MSRLKKTTPCAPDSFNCVANGAQSVVSWAKGSEATSRAPLANIVRSALSAGRKLRGEEPFEKPDPALQPAVAAAV
jgi:hypothetical protein